MKSIKCKSYNKDNRDGGGTHMDPIFVDEFNRFAHPIRIATGAIITIAITLTSDNLTYTSLLWLCTSVFITAIVYQILLVPDTSRKSTTTITAKTTATTATTTTTSVTNRGRIMREVFRGFYLISSLNVYYLCVGPDSHVYLYTILYQLPATMAIELITDSHLIIVPVMAISLFGSAFTMWFHGVHKSLLFCSITAIASVQLFSIAICYFMKRVSSHERLYDKQISLLNSKAMYKRLYRDAPCMFLLVDHDGNITNCNKAVLKLTGLDKKQIVGTKVWTLFAKEESVQYFKKFYAEKEREKHQTNDVCQFEVDMNSADGTSHFMVGYLAFTQEPTHIHMQNQDSDRLLSHIILYDMTAKNILNQKLQLAREKAEQASQAKSIFLGIVSHECRTPLCSIITHAEMLMKDSQLTAHHRDLLTSIKSSSDLLLALINDILDIQKVESGKNLELEPSSFSLKECLTTVEHITGSLAKAKDIVYNISFKDIDPLEYLFGDQKRLIQVLVNLINNAIKFTDRGLIEVTVTSNTSILSPCIAQKIDEHDQELRLKDDERRIIFQVKDTGEGIPSDQFQQLFLPFSQLKTSSSTHRRGGTGLGLAISKTIVELMRGKFFVESCQNVGSTFCFTAVLKKDLQYSKPSSPAISMNKNILNDHQPACDASQTLRILVVDDHSLNQQIMARILTYYGVHPDHITIAGNGQIAIDMVRNRFEANEEPFDAIFMDVEMPQVDGIRATTEIRQMDPNVPIIMLTANASSEIRQRAAQAGCTDFCSKPFSMKTIAQFLRRRSAIPLQQQDEQES